MSALTHNRFRWALVLAAMAVVAVALAALAQADEEVPAAAPDSGAAQVTTIDPAAADAVSALAEPRTSADAMPPEAEAQVDEHADFGMNPGLSRQAIGGTSSVYLVPAEDRVCAALTHGDATTAVCPEIDEIAGGDSAPATVMLAGGVIGIFGVVPDGVESVALAYGDRSSRTVEVTDNAYFAALPAGTAVGSVGYDGPGGAVNFPITDPASTDSAE